MSNAFKYTPDNGTITVAYHIDGDMLSLSVADTGEGIVNEIWEIYSIVSFRLTVFIPKGRE